jgi:hypothetical protein
LIIHTQRHTESDPLPRKKFNKEEADKIWQNYSKNLIDTITKTEKEGVEKGYSSYEIEKLWQDKVKGQDKKLTSES